MRLLDEALSGRPITSCPLLDFHVHIGRWPVLPMHVVDEGMLPLMDRVGVDRICINGILHPDVVEGNNQVIAFLRRHPDRVVGFAALNPLQCDMEAELQRCLDQGCRGIKVHEWLTNRLSRHAISDPRHYGDQWEKVWRLAARHRVPVLYHGVVTEDDIKAFPETTFVMAHGLCGIKGERDKRRLAGYPNLYLDTALTQNVPWESAETLRIFGPERLLWGTDAPLDDFAQRLGIILDLPMSDDDRRLIFGGNALRLLGLS